MSKIAWILDNVAGARAATFGRAAFGAGESKNTYGGTFRLAATGERIVRSPRGLLMTVAYPCGSPPHAMPGTDRSPTSAVH